MVFYGGLFLFFFVGFASSEGVCFTEFHTEMACVMPYGVTMHDAWSGSLISCARACSSNDSCASLIFFEGINTCRLNEQILTNITAACSNPQKYAEKVGNSQCSTSGISIPTTTTTTTTTTTITHSTTSTSTTTTPPGIVPPPEYEYMVYPYFFMSDPCITVLECYHIPNSECRDSVCQCVSGYSFEWPSRACVPGCHSYGHSYQIERDTTSRYDILVNNMSEVQCLSECTNRPNFNCTSLVYGVSTMACYLSSTTSLTHSPSPLNGYNLYHRDCLFV